MPEYLAPAVYVEEVDTGSKPIEGVSTSTCGVVGVTERGPANVPILVTSYGEYRRWFGEALSQDLYQEHRFLPHAVEGFFTNGGKRIYVTRVVAAAAAPAETHLLAVDPAAPTATQLALGAAVNDTTVLVLDGTGLAPPATVQIGAGVGAEFPDVGAAPAPGNVLALDLPLAFAHAAAVPNGVEAIPIPVPAVAPNDYIATLADPAAAGDAAVVAGGIVATTALAAGDLLAIDSGGSLEYAVVSGPAVGNTVPLSTGLQFDHASGATLTRVASPAAATQTQLLAASTPGATLVRLQATAGFVAGGLVRFNDANPAHLEIRRIGALVSILLSQPAYADYPAGSRIEQVTLPAPGAGIELKAQAGPGATVLQLADRSALSIDEVLQVGTGVDLELVAVAGLPAPLPGPANPGNVVLRAALRKDHAAGLNVVVPLGPPTAVTQTGIAPVDTAMNAAALVASMPAALAAGDVLRVRTSAGGVSYHAVAAAPVALAPQLVTLTQPLQQAEPAGAPLVVRTPMVLVRALDTGCWGNRLRAAMEVQGDSQLNTRVRQIVSATALRLDSASGVEAGTELTVVDAGNVSTRVKVADIDRQNDYLVMLNTTTPLPGALAVGDAVRSREYRFTLELQRQPDPSNALRNSQAIDREVFANLSLDPNHSRYFQRIIGTTWTPGNSLDDTGLPLRLDDRRSRGDSAYVRVQDLAPGTGLRRAPVAAYERRPGVPPRLVLLPLAHGDDVVGSLSDTQDYVGLDDPDPVLRTGLQTLRNVDEISVVSAPGRTSVTMQAALINHCELMRYRFAVLDGAPPPGDTLADVQAQRQQFDSKYAALYHPWLLIPDPYPQVAGTVPDYPIPPSGHMLGVYARTDIERGVHKAPANEVVRGVTGLQRTLNKEQQDILNPYPVNINVIRDFRPQSRGIRVYGGRVITSDSDWKYVNVRRLLIYIEASIDIGLQWVVFEPNAEPLWARVRRSVSNFLTQVWRGGALEGTKPEEAYFVKCDRTTMTQTDIDQGRLICLVGVAPVKPAEFVIVRIGLWTAHADD